MEIRPAEPEDALAVARVHVRTWQAAYRSLLPDHYLDQLRAEDRAARYQFRNPDPLRPRTIVAVEGGVILGFATTLPANQADLPDCGELAALHVDPIIGGAVSVRRSSPPRAPGSAILDSAMRCCGYSPGNVRADRFYRTDGWMPDGANRTDTVWGVEVNEIRYQRSLQ